MRAIFIIFISMQCWNSWATRSVPQEFTQGIESYLPQKYYKLFETKDKESGEYTVLVHQVTIDFLQIAEDARRKGQNNLSFRFLKLANYLFPYRDDVKVKYHQAASEIIEHLNTSKECTATYSNLVTIIHENFPKRFSEIKNEDCNTIVEQIKDIDAEISTKIAQEALNDEAKAEIFLNEYEKIAIKTEHTDQEREFLFKNLVRAFLGHIEIESFGPLSIDDEGQLTGQFFLFWKHSAMSYENFKNSYKYLKNSDQYETYKVIESSKVQMRIKLINNQTISVVNGKLEFYHFDYLAGLLRSMNLFNMSEIRSDWITPIYDPLRYTFHVPGIQMQFDPARKSYAFLRFKLNSMQKKDLKKIIINISE